MTNLRSDGAEHPADADPEVYAAVEHEMSVLLRRARAYSLGIAKEVHPDLDAAGYPLLLVIADRGSARASDLADYFGVNKAPVSRQVHQLELLGLITRAPDPDDARAQRLVATEEGARRLEAARTARRSHVRAQLEEWDTRDVREFAQLLSRFNALLG